MLPKRFLAIFMAFLMLCADLFAVVPDYNLKRGTTLSVRLMSSASSKGKTTPTAVVDNDVYSPDGKLLIKRGESVALQVNKQKARGCGKAGYVSVTCVSTTAADGQNISLNGVIEQEGQKKLGLALGLGIGLGLTVLPFVGFAFLAIKGGQATIDANTLIPNVTVMGDYNIR